MDITLTLNETRVIGSLIEKQITTPDQYPLSLNALANACNQKSNREPVLYLSETTVQATLDDLSKKHLIMEKGGFGSRVAKYQQRFAGTQFSALTLDEKELAMICVLFLRGPQTPGELRSRTQRLCKFEDVREVEATLEQLARREDGPFVVKLPREFGRRESRYAHLFSGAPEPSSLVQSSADPLAASSDEDHIRLAVLEQRVEELSAEIEQLKRRLDARG